MVFILSQNPSPCMFMKFAMEYHPYSSLELNVYERQADAMLCIVFLMGVFMNWFLSNQFRVDF